MPPTAVRGPSKPSVLITGASSGIGAATAELLLSRGFEVFGTSRNPGRLNASAPKVHWIAMDVRDEASVQAGIAQIQKQVKTLDALVCNSGFGIFGSVEEVSIEEAQEQFDTNFFGTLRTLRAAIPAMREARSGRIILVSSLAAHSAIPFQAHYSATKGAIDTLGLALRNELHPHGVAVSLVEPGDIHTDFNDAMDFGDHQNSPYSERILRCEKVIRDAFPKAPGPEIVAQTIAKALAARRPRVRYPVGPDSLGVSLGRRFLPDSLFLRLIRDHFAI
jgi:NAD(P)-dependent dehydrogenase (short-subunit alcohol dehydrogenase family)